MCLEERQTRLRVINIAQCTMGTFIVDAKDAGKGKRENEINQCLGGLPTCKIPGAHNPERSTAINSCNGVFTSEFIFR